MIVVAIIAILAAIALPQFNSYQTRAFNAAALSDINNLQQAEVAYFTKFQHYAYTYNGTNENATLQGPLEGGLLYDGNFSLGITVSKDVCLWASGKNTYFLMAKNKNGNLVYAVNNKSVNKYVKTSKIGLPLSTTGFNSSSVLPRLGFYSQ